VWSGRNKIYQNTPLVKNNARYLKILESAVTSFQSHHANNNNAPSLPVSHERRKQLFWSMIKNMPVYAVTQNIFGPHIGETTVNKYNKNGTRFRNSAAANYLDYIGRKNEGTVNLFRRKTAVKKIETAFQKRTPMTMRRM
jgi:hypothetical protein